MREIKFRGISITSDRLWVYGFFIGENAVNDKHSYIEHGGALYDVFTDTVGQFTGMKDKNGRKIYEGDIIKDGLCQYVVVWFDVGFRLKSIQGGHYYSINRSLSNFLVVGNIYDIKNL